jgi:hypothetical protein
VGARKRILCDTTVPGASLGIFGVLLFPTVTGLTEVAIAIFADSRAALSLRVNGDAPALVLSVFRQNTTDADVLPDVRRIQTILLRTGSILIIFGLRNRHGNDRVGLLRASRTKSRLFLDRGSRGSRSGFQLRDAGKKCWDLCSCHL